MAGAAVGFLLVGPISIVLPPLAEVRDGDWAPPCRTDSIESGKMLLQVTPSTTSIGGGVSLRMHSMNSESTK